MAPRKRVGSETAGAPQALGDNVKRRRAAASNSSSRKRKRISDCSDEAESSQVDQRKAKRPKWSRIVGRLAGLMELPMDILFEIFGHLLPLDVLRLARTTKQFRQLLMHRSAVSIWIAARKNVPDLPDCPPYMSEPQFANLVFDTHCHECLSPNIRSIDWRIGRRICTKCAKECMVEDYSLYVGESVYKAVPSKYGKRGRPAYYSRDLNEFQTKRASFTDPEERDKFVKERQALVIQMEKHGALLETWAANQAKDRSEQLDDLRRERKEAIIEKLTELGWGPEIERIPYRDDLSHHKLVKQPIRLTTRIWSNIQAEMVNYMEQMKTQRLERERKALVISRKRTAVSILRTYKISNLPLVDVMPEPMDFCAFPQVLEIVELPTETQVTEDTFAPLVEKMDELVDDWRTRIIGLLAQKIKDAYTRRARTQPSSETVDATSSDSAGKGKAKATEPSVPDDAQIIQDLSLATTIFNCKCCNPGFSTLYGLRDIDFSSSDTDDDFFDPWGFARRPRLKSSPLFFPKVLGHHCLTKQHGTSWDYSSGDPIKQYNYPMGNRTRWDCNLLQLDEKAGKMAAKVVETCGLDPEKTTVAEMDQLNHQLACMECLKWSKEELDLADATVFGWRDAVAHNCRIHPNRTNVEWKLIDEELAPDVDVIESTEKIISAFVFQSLAPNSDPFEDAVWLCAHCLDLPSEPECTGLSKVKTHLSMTHSISEPQENQDYYEDYEGRKKRAPHLKISLNLERPEHVRAPGEGCGVYGYDEPDYESYDYEPWGFGFSEDEFEDDFYGDDFFF